jgi:hypothetical protein
MPGKKVAQQQKTPAAATIFYILRIPIKRCNDMQLPAELLLMIAALLYHLTKQNYEKELITGISSCCRIICMQQR